MCAWVHFSPQCCKHFEKYVNFFQPNLYAKGIKCLDIYVLKFWNSTFSRFQCSLVLEKNCTHFCQQNSDTSAYLLKPEKWDQAWVIIKLIEPLSEATEMLCSSKYPTLNCVLPVYVFLIQHLHLVCQGLYDQFQLIPPAYEMINKINQYLTKATQNPLKICTMVLNLNFMTIFWKNNKEFIRNNFKLFVDDLLQIFSTSASKLKESVEF